MEMATDIDPKRVEKLRDQLSKEPEFAAIVNELWWLSVRERCEELPPDQRHQAEDHLDALILLLRNADDGEGGAV